MNINKIKSFAKINLALNVTGKLVSLHKVESIVSFINLYDLITIKRTNNPKHQVFFNGKFSKNIKNTNTVKKLFDILDEKKLLENKKFQVKINKNIPQEAGLGGGSMNAANILSFLIKKKFIKLNQKKIRMISNLIGSDVILGISSKSTVLTSNNVIKKFFRCPRFYTLLVHPNFGCSTKKIYSGVKNFTKPKFDNPKKAMFGSKFLINQDNALEKIAFLKYPKLKEIKSFLENLKSPLFVRMTGSGSVIVAYYRSKQDCKLAKVQYKRKFNSHWCIESKTI
jgi:4-diphosphocytidyl-2-C-methyl-D-erythritol kinase